MTAQANAFDDLAPGLLMPQVAAAPTSNAFDDITPPISEEKSQEPTATARNRLQAAEGGVLKGGAYFAGLIPDTILNAIDLGKAGAGTLYSLGSGKRPPDWLEVNGEPSPVGGAIARLMDKSPITTTQPTRPDDPVSRYLSTAGSVVPGVAAGGGGIPAALKGLAIATPPAMAAQYVSEAKPFQSDTANTGATLATQVLASAFMPRGRGALLPENAQRNAAVTAGQEAGYVFPPATTNPSAGNRVVETIAGKTNLQQHASLNNQEVTNQLGRQGMRLPEGKGPITDLEIATAKANAVPGYDALRGVGQVKAPPNFQQQLNGALKKQSGAGKLDPSLRNTDLERTVANLGKNKTFDASDAMDTISVLRDKASQAYRAGDSSTGAAYRSVSKVLEDAIDQDLSTRGGSAAQILSGYRDSRQQFARIATVEDARNSTTGNLIAGKLAAALKNKEPLTGELRVAGEAAGQAPRAFAEPTHSAGVNHLGLYGSLAAGALAAHEYLPEHWGLGGAAAAAAIPLARAGARSYAFGLGQRNALPRGPGPIDPRLLLGGYTSGSALTNQ